MEGIAAGAKDTGPPVREEDFDCREAATGDGDVEFDGGPEGGDGAVPAVFHSGFVGYVNVDESPYRYYSNPTEVEYGLA